MSHSKRTAVQTTKIKYGFENPSNGDGARKLLEAFVDEILTRRLEPPPTEQTIEESFSSSSFVEKLSHPLLDKIPLKSQQHVWPMQTSTKRKQIIDLANKLRINDGCLARIRLASSQIDDSLIHSLAEGLPRNIYLQALMLQDNSITDKGVQEIALAARWHPSLHTIWLGGNQLTDECTKSICLLLKVNFVVKDINLSNKWPRHTWTGANVDVFPHISAVGAQLLADRISRGCSLTSLTLADQRVCDEGANHLFKSLRGSRLRCLNLMANELTDGCCEALKACLICDQHLEKLVVSKNHFTDTGAGIIAEVLQTSNVLKALDISDNQIGAPGMASLAQSLKANMGLCILAAHGNTFDSKPVDDAMAVRLASQDFNALFATNLDFSSLPLPLSLSLPQATMPSTIGGPFDSPPSAVTGSSRPRGDSEKPTSDIDEKLDKSTRHPWRASPNAEVPGISGAGVRGHRPLSRSRSGSGGFTAGGGTGRSGGESDDMAWETQQLSRCSTSRAVSLNAILEEKEEAHDAIPSPTGHAKAIDAVSPSPQLFSPVRTRVSGPGSSSKASPPLGNSADDLNDPQPDKSATFVTPIKSKGSVSMKLSSTSASMNRLLVSDRRSSQSPNSSPSQQQAVVEAEAHRNGEKQRPRRLSEDVGKTRGVPNLGNMGTLPIRSNISPLQDSAQHLMYARITTPDDPPSAKAYSILQVAIDRRKEIERIKEEHKSEQYRRLKRDALWYTKPRYGLQQAAERPLPEYFWAGLKRENIYKYPHGIDRPGPTHKPKLKSLS